MGAKAAGASKIIGIDILQEKMDSRRQGPGANINDSEKGYIDNCEELRQPAQHEEVLGAAGLVLLDHRVAELLGPELRGGTVALHARVQGARLHGSEDNHLPRSQLSSNSQL